MLRFPDKDRTRPTIHLTALIDIVFLLLVFFLLASSFVEQEGVAIIVPEIESAGADLLPQVVVNIDQNGVVSVKGVVLNDRQLVNVLTTELEKLLNYTVIVKADRRVEYDIVVKTIDAAKLAGAENILLVTQRKIPESN